MSIFVTWAARSDYVCAQLHFAKYRVEALVVNGLLDRFALPASHEG